LVWFKPAEVIFRLKRKEDIFDSTQGFPGEGPSLPLMCLTANTNSFRTFKNKIMKDCTQDILLLQETHITHTLTGEGDTNIDRAKEKLKKQGYRSEFSAASHTIKGGTSGGVAIAWRCDREAHSVKEITPGRALSVTITSTIGQIIFVSIYGYVNDTGLTKDLLKAITTYLCQNGKPFIIGGDFNASPEQISSHMHDLNVPCHVVTPAGTTCQSTGYANCIDYFVVHPKVKALCNQPSCIMQGKIAPHDPVQVAINLVLADRNGNFIERPI
jgi:hypothetical protein